MRKEGRVVGIVGEEAVIELTPEGGCSSCSVCKGLDVTTLTVKNEKLAGLKLGDNVEIEIKPPALMRIYVSLYFIPLIAFIAGIFTYYIVFRSPVISLAIGIAATIVSYVLTGKWIKENIASFIDIYTKHSTNI